MPGWLDKVVPHVSIEGQEFFDARDKEQARGLVREPEPAGATSD
jgi:hypothetical protein